MTLFGRTQEQTLLNTLIASKQAEFLAIYGRRRVGKTLLINTLNTAITKNATYPTNTANTANTANTRNAVN